MKLNGKISVIKTLKLKKWLFKPVLLTGFIFMAFAVFTSPAFAAHCNIQPKAGGYFFDNFETAEYVNGFLTLHFKLKAPYNDGRTWEESISFLSDECTLGATRPFGGRVSITSGIKLFSIRFTSQTHFEIWNDETNIKETCANCSQDFPPFPGYYEIIVSGFIDGGASIFNSSSYRISNNAADPPNISSTLPTPQGCVSVLANGYFFDNYERAEYVNGLLTYHFRFKTPYNDGRPWYSGIRFYNELCQVKETTKDLGIQNTKLTPYIRYYSIRFSTQTHYDIWNDETNQKENCLACSVDIPMTTTSGLPYSFISFAGIIDPGYETFLDSTPFPIQEKQSNPDPVIIIPGILGSSDKNGEWVIDPIFHTYDDLIATLEANGYEKGKDLFTLPYDWRESNILTALKLRNKINEVQTTCNCDKVDLVAHSMGGLVARQYIQSDKYENDVDQLIFLGTPHLGSPDSYLMWEGGEIGTKMGGIFQEAKDRFSKFILSKDAQKAGFTSLFDYVRNRPIPSVQELLPIYDYLRDKSSGILRTYPNNYPRNTFLENLNTGVTNLLTKVKVTNIIGDLGNASTLSVIKVVDSPNLPLWENGYPDGFDNSTINTGFEFGFGDGTVPLASANYINQDLISTTSSHVYLPTVAESIIFKKLTGKDVSITFDTNSIFKTNVKLLLIKILSPVDVVVIAPDGKRIGKDFGTNQEVNEIAEAFYSGFLTDNEYITIPNPLDGEYKIQAKGTGSGSYTVATGYISDNISVDKDFTAQTQLEMTTELNLVVNNETPTNLDIKPKDITPPEIVTISPQSKDYLRSETIPVNVTISDTESGVFSQSIKFDDKIVNNGDNIDFFFEKLGNHSLTVATSDFVGNSASTTVNFRIIATSQSTIADIKRSYALGWINKASVKNTLIRKLENIVNHNRDITQKTLKTFLAEIEREHPKHINDQAYNLLKEDVGWLLSN